MTMNGRTGGALALLVMVLLASCASARKADVYVSTEEQLAFDDIRDISRQVAEFDAWMLLRGTVPQQERDARAQDLLAQIADAKGGAGVRRALLARLEALEGIVLLLGGRTRAKDSYERSRAYSKGDAMTLVLASRLGLSADLASGAEQVEGSRERSLLTLEQAVQAYRAGDYRQAVAWFDESFIALEQFYQEAYKQVRDRSWDLRTLSDGTADDATRQILEQPALTAEQMLVLTQGETALLSAWTGGKRLSARELFRTAQKQGLLEPASAARPDAAVTRDQTATRLLCARYLWNLRTQGNASARTAYSSLYRSGGTSPVPDVPVDSPDFDAVLGCVEHEIMDLPDGISFLPDGKPSAMEFRRWLLTVPSER